MRTPEVSFLVSDEDKEIAREFFGGINNGVVNRYDYKDDSEIDEISGYIVKEIRVMGYHPVMCAIKYGLPVELVRNIHKGKKYGLYTGKPYTDDEFLEKFLNSDARNKMRIISILSQKKNEFPIYASDVHIIVSKKDDETAKKRLIETMQDAGLPVKSKTRIYSVKRESEINYADDSAVEYAINAFSNSTLLEEFDWYQKLSKKMKGDVSTIARVISDDVFLVKNKKAFVNLDKDRLIAEVSKRGILTW